MKEKTREKPLSKDALRRIMRFEALPEEQLMQAKVLMDGLAKIAFECKINNKDNFNNLKNWTPNGKF